MAPVERGRDGLGQPADPVGGAGAQAVRPAAGQHAARRRRGQPGLVPAPRRLRRGGPARRPGAVRPGALRGAALPLQLQLPGRREPPGGAGRGGGPAGPVRGRPDRPRRDVRGGPVRRGGEGLRHAHALRRGAVDRADRAAGRPRRPGRATPAGARPRPGGLPAALPADQRRAAGRRDQGPPALRRRRADRGARRPLAGAHRLPQGRGPGGAGGRRVGRDGRRPRRAGRAGRALRAGQRGGRAVAPRRPAGRRAQRRAGRAGRGPGPAHGGHRQRALRLAAPAPAGHRAGRGPGPAQPGRDGRLAARGRHRPPALRRGDGGAVPPLPRRGGPGGRARPGVRVRRSTWWRRSCRTGTCRTGTPR